MTVGESERGVSVLIEAMEPVVQGRQVHFANAAPIVSRDPAEQLAEDQFGIRAANGQKARAVLLNEPVIEAARMPEQPVAPAVASTKRLGVGVAHRPPGGVADMNQKKGGSQVLPGAHQLAADAAVRRRR